MARIKRDSGAWVVSGIQKRDARHTHGEPEVMPGPRKKKDTKRWCRGKRGNEHSYEWVPDKRHPATWKPEVFVLQCENCGKIEDYCWGNWFMSECCCPRHGGIV